MGELKVGYWAGQEQYDPNTLINYAKLAEVVGFDIIITSDHFHPWRDSNAFNFSPHSGFPWIWLAAAASKTNVSELGTAVTTPGYRYHPAIVAQAFATLAYLYPGRISITVGAGHRMNETPLGYNWPNFQEKVDRLKESILIIRELWKGKYVNFKGEYFTIKQAKLYTIPKKNIPLYVATSNSKVAAIAGELCDGILTNPRGLDKYVSLINSMKSSAKKVGRNPEKLDISLEFKVSYDLDYDTAFKSATYWAPAAIPRNKRDLISTPKELEKNITDSEIEKIRTSWLITSDVDEIIKKIGEFLKMGFNRVYIHSASPDEKKFLRMLGRDILPWMREIYDDVAP